MSRIPDLPRYLAQALDAVCFGDPETIEAAADRYFSCDYEQTVDGETLDRAQAIEHFQHLRSQITDGRIEVCEAIQDGTQIADRHIARMTRTDATEVTVEIYLFGELDAEGRIRRVREVSRLITGRPDDQELARAR